MSALRESNLSGSTNPETDQRASSPAASAASVTHPADTDDLAARVAAFMAASAIGGTRVGPFTVHFDGHSANVFRNYAVPDRGAMPSHADIDALVAAFDRRDRTPRLEYVPSAAPAVEPALVAAGFTADFRSPVFGCRRGAASDLGAPAGISLSLVSAEDDLLDVVRAQNSAYGEPAPAGPADVARLVALNARGGVVALARDAATGQPAGGGLCQRPVDGATELAAIGVTASYRRRGIGSALAAFLARAMHDRGADLVWLERDVHVPNRLYELAGFTLGAEKLWISRPAGVIIAGAMRLHPISVPLARSIMGGDLSGLPAYLRPARGWPHEDTAAGMWMVVNKGADGWLVTHDGAVIGDAGALIRDGEATFAFTVTPAYRESNVQSTISAALAGALGSRPGIRSVTDGAPVSVDRRPPAIVAGERDTLVTFIDYLRECLIAKLAGLSEADARRSTVDSGTSVLGLVKHVASMEHAWIAYSFAGGDAEFVAPRGYGYASAADIPDEELSDADTIESVVAAARAVGARTNEMVAACNDMDQVAAVAYGSDAKSLRWILVHLVEEIGRHAGHADILREQIDGTTGR